jgi:hypothetical protein
MLGSTIAIILLLEVGSTSQAKEPVADHDLFEAILDLTDTYLPTLPIRNTIWDDYQLGRKHYLVIGPAVSVGPDPDSNEGPLWFGALGDLVVIIDLDDYLRLSEEGEQDWITIYLRAATTLGGGAAIPHVSLGYRSVFTGHFTDVNAADAPMDFNLWVGAAGNIGYRIELLEWDVDGNESLSASEFSMALSAEFFNISIPFGPYEVHRSILDSIFYSVMRQQPATRILDRYMAIVLANEVLGAILSGNPLIRAATPYENGLDRSPSADFAIENISWNIAQPFPPGTSPSYTFHLINMGLSSGSGHFRVFLDGSQIYQSPLVEIAPFPQERVRPSLSIPASLNSGLHTLGVEIYNVSPADDRILNNNLSTVFTVSGFPISMIESVVPGAANQGVDSLVFTGFGEDPGDPGNPAAIDRYRWVANPGFGDVAGADVLYEGSSNQFTLSVADVSRLTLGHHTIELTVRRASDGVWSSVPATAQIEVVENTPPPPVGTFLSGGTVESPILAEQSPRYSIVYRNTAGTIPSSARVIINGTIYNMNAMSGDYTTGKLYAYEGIIFSTAGSSNNYYFEFVVGGETKRYPETGTLSGPVVENTEANLHSGVVNPPSGDSSQVFTYTVIYQHPEGKGPKYDSVALWVDGAAQGINMWRTIPNNDDWENGVEFKALVGGLTEGTHQFHFSCAVGTSTHNVRYPESGEASGPTVGETVGMQVTITPHASYDVGDWAEFDIEVRDENGVLTDPDEWEFWRMDNSQILYAEDTAVTPPHGHMGTGAYYLRDYNSPLTAGYHRYKMVVWKDGYPRTDKFLELPIAVTPDVPVRITDIDVSPMHFKPGSGDISVLYDLSADAYVRVDVYGASGNLVKTIAGPNAFRAAGSHSETWNGTDSGGSPVGVGQYRFEVWARADVSGNGSDVLYDGNPFAVDGSANNLTNKPSDILYDRVHDQVILTEDFNSDTGSQTQRFTVDGTFVANFASVAGMYAKNAVAQDTDGNYYVQDIEGGVFKFNSSYVSQGSIMNVGDSSEHAALATNGSTFLYAANNQSELLVRRNLQTGEMHSASGYADYVDGIAVDADGNVWVAVSAGTNVLDKYDQDLNSLGVSFPFGLSTAGADVCIKHGHVLYLLLYSGTLKVYDIKNEAWLPDISVSNTRPSAIDAAENGYTFVNFDDGDYNAMRYRDRISADSNFALVEAVAVVPDAEITSPIDSQTVGLDISTSVTISGTAKAAAGTTFDHFMLEVGQGASPTEWGLIIEGDVEVDNGVLGEWNLDGVWDGDHRIRLRVFDTQGVVGEDRVTVNVQAPNQPPETYANGDTLSADSVTVHLSARDDTTPDENVEYSWQLNHGVWSAYTTDTAIALTGIGSGQNTFRARAKDAEGLIDQTPATLTIDGTVDHAPNTPVNIYPFGGQPDAPPAPTLISSVFRDSDPASAFSKAQFQIRADSGDYDSPVWNTEITPAANHVGIPQSVLQNTGTYWWRCRYQDDSGQWSAWSVETKFTVLAQDTAAKEWPLYE